MRYNSILFIIPPHGPYDSYVPKGPGQKKYFLTPPYGVLSIISYINEHTECSVEIFDCNKSILDNVGCEDIRTAVHAELIETVNRFKPDCVGISALFNTSFPHMELVALMKKVRDVPVFIGGGLATNLYEDLFTQFSLIDAICFGEGELPMVKLLGSNVSFLEAHAVSNAWVTKKSISLNQEPQHDMVANIDDISLVDFSYIELGRYNGRSYIEKDPTKHKIEVSIHTSRGCPFNCVFCANGKLHGKKVRLMSFDRIAETIRHYVENYGMTILLVEDDHFLYNKERAIKILEFIHNNNITVEFPNGLAVYKIDNDIAAALAKARVKLVTLAIESGSDYVLSELIDKPLTTDKIREVVAVLRQYDIRIHVFVVIGLPGEYDVHREDTLNFIIDLEIDWAYIFIAAPIVGSRLFKICKDNDYLVDNSYDNHIVSRGNIRAPGVDPREIEEYAYYMNIMINFIHNSNMKRGKYDVAEEYFSNVVRSYPTQAIAHYMLHAISYTRYLEHYDTHLGKYKNSRFWGELLGSVFTK